MSGRYNSRSPQLCIGMALEKSNHYCCDKDDMSISSYMFHMAQCSYAKTIQACCVVGRDDAIHPTAHRIYDVQRREWPI